MNETDLRRSLEEERERLTRLQQELSRDHGGGERDDQGELSSVDQHPADVGSELFEREKDMSISEGFGDQLAEIEAAFERLDSGNFGRCEVCQQQIGDDRLAAVPWTRYCVEHQATAERT